MSIFYYISITVFALYILCIAITKGVTKSISASVYELGENKLISSLFTWFCFLTSITLLPYWIDYSDTDLNIIPFVACSSLIFVGASPYFKSHQKIAHFSSAIVCFASTYLWIYLYADPLILRLSIIALIALSLSKNRLFWWELTAFATIYKALMLNN